MTIVKINSFDVSFPNPESLALKANVAFPFKYFVLLIVRVPFKSSVGKVESRFSEVLWRRERLKLMV
jgi:hypothetical protein